VEWLAEDDQPLTYGERLIIQGGNTCRPELTGNVRPPWAPCNRRSPSSCSYRGRFGAERFEPVIREIA
jgi:hypothetical protein